MKEYKIEYWLNGNKYIYNIKAENIIKARYLFEMTVANDDVISIVEVVE